MVAVITYDVPHKKTQNTVNLLLSKNYNEITLLALPFLIRENPFVPLYAHRPNNYVDISPYDWSKELNINYIKTEVSELESNLKELNPQATLIAGAGLLPTELVENQRIINSHPAYLPLVRGLDALKWAIVERKPIGVTSHFVDSQADAGFMIDRKEVPVYKDDTFLSVAERQFNLEIEMLVDAISLIQEKPVFPELPQEGVVHKRMPKNIEKDLLNYFEHYKNQFSIEKL